MKKIIMTLCLIAFTTGIASAAPMRHSQPAPQNIPVREHREVRNIPQAIPVVYQVPVPVSNYTSGYPNITFSNKYFEVSVGL